MKKDYSKWHTEKSNIQEIKERPFFNEHDIWSVSTGANVGFEIDGKGDKFLRPMIVIKKFNKESFWGLSITRSIRKGPYYFSFSFKEGEISTANLSQLRLVDAKRLRYKLGGTNKKDFKELKEKLRQLIT
ncbi:MAG TPA: type II toxin-antitoxin system PemK/MazF family toxin [Candidatus Paceibacterota bacterium]